MSDGRDEDTVEVTLELPAEVIAELEKLRAQFGDELIIDLIRGAAATNEGKLALRGDLPHKDRK